MWERVSSLFYVIWFLPSYVHSSSLVKEMCLDEHKPEVKTQAVLEAQTWEFRWCASDWGRHKRISTKSAQLDSLGFTHCGSDLNYKDVSAFLRRVAQRWDGVCSVLMRDHWGLLLERLGWKKQLGVVMDHEKCVPRAWSFRFVLNLCGAVVPPEGTQCFFSWCDGEWMGRRLQGGYFFLWPLKAGDMREAMGSCARGREESRSLG